MERFTAGVHLQQCFGPGASDAQYCRALALRLTADDEVVVHASHFAARQLQAVALLLGACRRPPPQGGKDWGEPGSPRHSAPIRQVGCDAVQRYCVGNALVMCCVRLLVACNLHLSAMRHKVIAGVIAGVMFPGSRWFAAASFARLF